MDDHENELAQTEQTLKVALSKVQDATFELLFAKPRRKTSFFVTVQDEDGSSRQVRLRYQAMDPKAFDDLLAAHAPSPKDERKGAQWNPDTFPPALISEVALSPKLSYEEAQSLLKAPNWSPGEISALFRNALEVCQAGLNVPFSDGD